MYTINEDGTVTRNASSHNSSSPQPSGGSEDNTGCWVTCFIAVVIGILVFAVANENDKSSSHETSEGPAYEEFVDSVIENNNTVTYLDISASSVSFDADGGYYTFIVSSNSTWNISTDTYDWGHLTRSGNQLTLRVDANPSMESRTDYFILSAGNETVRVDISQEGKVETYLNVSPSNLYFTSSGGSQTLNVETNSNWIVSVDTDNWGHLSKSGNQLILRVDANNSSASRTDYFCIKTDGIERRVNITQEGISSYSNSSNVAGTIKNVWVDHNVSDSYGNKGMKIHIKFDINGMLNRRGQAAAYFYYTNGNPLKDRNGYYCTSNGNVATHVDFTPIYENCTYNDLSIFMPYTELHQSQSASCFFTVSIWSGSKEITQSERFYFDITL